MQNCACGSPHVTVQLRTGMDGGPAGMMCVCQECGASWQPEPFKPSQPISAPQLATEPLQQNKTVSTQVVAKPKRVTRRNLLADARRQIKEMDAEIARLEKLRRERDELVRLVNAAKSSDGPKVVAMRRAQ